MFLTYFLQFSIRPPCLSKVLSFSTTAQCILFFGSNACTKASLKSIYKINEAAFHQLYSKSSKLLIIINFFFSKVRLQENSKMNGIFGDFRRGDGISESPLITAHLSKPFLNSWFACEWLKEKKEEMKVKKKEKKTIKIHHANIELRIGRFLPGINNTFVLWYFVKIVLKEEFFFIWVFECTFFILQNETFLKVKTYFD